MPVAANKISQLDAQPTWVLTVAVALIALLAYLPALGHGLVFDDLSLIGPEGPRFLGNDWLPYRPLRFASLWLDHRLFGATAWGYHLTNLLLHAAVTALVHRIAIRLGVAAMAAALGALVFAVHPMAVESVAYVSGRRDLLAMLFSVAALGLWTASPCRHRLAVVMLLAAVASKESGLLACAVLALASLTGRTASRGSLWSVLVPTAAAGLALTLAYGARGPVLVLAGSEWVTTSGRLALHYLSGLALLRPLAVDYPALHLAGTTTAATGLAMSLVGICAVVLAIVALRRRTTALGFVLAWLLLELFVVSGFVGMHEPGADRHAYRLLFPASLGLALLLDRTRKAYPVYAGALALLACLSAATTAGRVPVWADGWTLWSSTVVTAPASARAHYNVAAMLAEAGATGHAREHMRAALRADPGYEPARLGLARMACLAGYPRRARSLAGRPICGEGAAVR